MQKLLGLNGVIINMINKVLMVVDMQKGFMTNYSYKKLNDKIQKLMNDNNYDLIVLTKFINKNNSLCEIKLNWNNLKDLESQKISFEVPEGALIFEKYGYGLGNEQINKLKELDIKEVDLCGLEADACVYAIALQLFDNDIFPNILINYVETKDSLKEAIKKMMIRQFGSVDEKI